jgi:hypothetical protein
MNLSNTNPQAVGEAIINKGFETFSFKIGSLTISPNYMVATLIVFLIFFLILAMARMHRLFINWSFKGAAGGVLIGFLLCLIIEGFFMVSGSTILTSAFGWKNAPKPIQNVLDAGRSHFVKVLGASTEVCNP